MGSTPELTKKEMVAFVESEEWQPQRALLDATRPMCVVILTKTFCCGRLHPVELAGEVLDHWLNTNYFYLSGYCPDCGSKALTAQWSITHYNDAHIIWNGHGLEPNLDEDSETLLH